MVEAERPLAQYLLQPALSSNENIVKYGRSFVWKCKCDCGNITDVCVGHLRSGHTKSCGKCSNFIKDLSGFESGQLTAIYPSMVGKNIEKSNNGSIMWVCKCECGNTIKCRSSSISAGEVKSCGCLSVQKNVSQNVLAELICKILCNYSCVQNYKKLEWLVNPKTGYLLEVDIYFPNLKVAIEYDGKQHFEPVCFGGISESQAKENLKNTRTMDKLKNKLIKNHIKNNSKDIKYFVRFDYREKLTKITVENKLKKIGVPTKQGV